MPNGDPTADYGLQLTLKIGSSENRLSSGWFLALDLPNADGSSGPGAATTANNIKNCNGTGLPDWRHAEPWTPSRGT